MTARNELRFKFHLDHSTRRLEMKDGPELAKPPSPPRVPRVARLMALAHHFERLIQERKVTSMADLARLGRVTRARITQIMDLLLLAPDIQEDLLFLTVPAKGHDPVALRTMRYVCQTPVWAEQRARWAEIKETLPPDESTTSPTTPARKPRHFRPLAGPA